MSILDLFRRAPATTAPAVIPRQRALNTMDGAPYDAASIGSAEMQDWFPALFSPDIEINPWRDRVVSRLRDLVRNDGWASGAISSLVDTAIGANFSPVPDPNVTWLRLQFPGVAFDDVWAEEFSDAAEAQWNVWGNDPNRWSDAARRQTLAQLQRTAFRHYCVDGDALAQLAWDPKRIDKSGYATCVQLIDPDRLSNPNLVFDLRYMRGGVEIDSYGAAIAYHIRRAHQGDWFAAPDQWIWDKIPRETADGRPIIVHHFDSDRAGQHRAVGGILTPIVQTLKMQSKKDQVELQAAVVNAIFSAYVESPYDPADVREAMETQDGGGDIRTAQLSTYQKMRNLFHDERGLRLNGVRVPTLMSGEKIASVAANRPGTNYEAFQAAGLRNVAAATGQTYEQVSRDWSRTNYSSARGALMDAWKSIFRRRVDFGIGFSTPIYCAQLEEGIERGFLPLPRGAPEFFEARSAYAQCHWMGPGRGWVDPVKEGQAAILRMDGGLTTLVQECGEQGLYWKKVLRQRAKVLEEFDRLKIPRPTWGQEVAPANALDRKPKAA